MLDGPCRRCLVSPNIRSFVRSICLSVCRGGAEHGPPKTERSMLLELWRWKPRLVWLVMHAATLGLLWCARAWPTQPHFVALLATTAALYVSVSFVDPGYVELASASAATPDRASLSALTVPLVLQACTPCTYDAPADAIADRIAHAMRTCHAHAMHTCHAHAMRTCHAHPCAHAMHMPCAHAMRTCHAHAMRTCHAHAMRTCHAHAMRTCMRTCHAHAMRTCHAHMPCTCHAHMHAHATHSHAHCHAHAHARAHAVPQACEMCMVDKPPRAKHCYDCGR